MSVRFTLLYPVLSYPHPSPSNLALSPSHVSLKHVKSSIKNNFMKIIFSNVRSFKNKFDLFLAQRAVFPRAIYCFTETWLTDDVRDCELFPQYYQIFRSDRQYDGVASRGGGVLVLVPHDISATLEGTSYCGKSFEAIAVKIKARKYITLLTLYRPPTNYSERFFLADFSSFFYSSGFDARDLLIVGDFNFPFIDWEASSLLKNNRTQEQFLHFCLTNSLVQVVNFPTRESNYLDIALLNDVHILESVDSLEPLGSSDHCQVVLTIKPPRGFQANAPEGPRVYCFAKANYHAMEFHLSGINWELMFSCCLSVSQQVDALNSILNNLFASYIPLSKSRQVTPFFPQALRRANRRLRSLYRAINKYQLDSAAKLLYATHLKEYKSKVQKYFKSREQRILTSKNTQKFWSFLRSKTSSRPAIPSLISDNLHVENDLDKAEIFNASFSSVFVKDNGKEPVILKRSNAKIESIEFDLIDVYDLLNNQSNKCSKGPDGIPHIVYHKLAVTLTLPLYLIFKNSLSSGEVAQIWKKATVIPVFKKGQKSDPQNYRPISLTCIPCRLLEKLVSAKLMKFFGKSGVSFPNQYGFLPGKSTVAQLLSSLNQWTLAVDRRDLVCVAYLDFQKAFDSVSHSKLISVLHARGIRGGLLNWISNFLTGRTQSVLVGNKLSRETAVTSGVPQGSVLGPLLFILYISDLPSVVKNSKLLLYADDCKLFLSCRHDIADITGLQNDLDRITTWAEQMQLKLATPKCSFLAVNGRGVSLSLKLGTENLVQSSSIRDLGIIIDDKLNFDAHCCYVARKACNVINLIFRSFKTRKVDFLLRMYTTYVLPIVDYGCAVYLPHSVKNIKLIESIQRRFTRRIPIFFRAEVSYSDRLKTLKLDSLELRAIKISLCFLYKLIYGFIDMNFSDMFSFYKDPATRTNGLKIRSDTFHTDVRKYFFAQRIVPIWNALPREVVTSTSVCHFRNELNRPAIVSILSRHLISNR